MPNNTPYSDLKTAIGEAEKRQLASKQALQQEFRVTINNLKPMNLLKNSIKNITESAEVQNNVLSFLIPLAFGFLSKRAFAGARTANIAKQLGITVLDGLNRYVNQNPDVINSVSHFILNFFRKKQKKEEQTD